MKQNRKTGLMQPLADPGIGRKVQRIKNAVHLPPHHIFQNFLLLLLIIVRDRGQQIIPVFFRFVHQRVDITSALPLRKTAHDKTDRFRSSRTKRPGNGIRVIIQPLHSFVNPAAGLFGDACRFRMVQIKRDQLRSHSHIFRNVFQCRFHLFPSIVF